MTGAPTVHFQPGLDEIAASPLTDFTGFCNETTGEEFWTYADLHRWSVQEPGAFWSALLAWSDMLFDGDAAPALKGQGVREARFFPEIRVSYTENLLAHARARPDALAITGCDESGTTARLTFGELAEQVERLAAGLAKVGVREGDRVVAVVRNSADAIVTCLAVTGLGATWSSTAPDMGSGAILSRFTQLDPRWLVAHTVQTVGGQETDLAGLVSELVGALPTLEGVFLLDGDGHGHGLGASDGGGHGIGLPRWSRAAVDGLGDGEVVWPRLPFDHPLFILFSSGTTGAPKCIVHGVGGTLLTHIKEHRLHTGLTPEDTLYFHTTCGWMMWNWLVSALAGGTHIVVYDGSVSYPGADALLQMLARERVTVFGTSPVYLQFLELSGVVPTDVAQLGAMRLMLSTGAVLYPRHFDFVKTGFGGLPIYSISGGTDIIGCFVLGCPNLPVYRGESPCVGLGFDVRALRDGEAAQTGVGELVCVAPFPSRPVGFFGADGESRFEAAYFAQHPGVWTHGDFIELTERGTARILGRSDGILNIKGVRIGPAEIYGALHDVEALADTMALALEDPEALGGRRLVLLVVMADGHEFERKLMWRIKRVLKQRCSPTHVPERVLPVPDLPTTHSGKRSERAAQDALDGRPVRNREALRNPESLDAILSVWRAG